MHATAQPVAAKSRATKIFLGATAPALLAVLLGMGGATVHTDAQGPIVPAPARTGAPADTSWGGCGGQCSQQP